MRLVRLAPPGPGVGNGERVVAFARTLRVVPRRLSPTRESAGSRRGVEDTASIPLNPCEALVGSDCAFLDFWIVLLHTQGIDSRVRVPKTRSSTTLGNRSSEAS